MSSKIVWILSLVCLGLVEFSSADLVSDLQSIIQENFSKERSHWFEAEKDRVRTYIKSKFDEYAKTDPQRLLRVEHNFTFPNAFGDDYVTTFDAPGSNLALTMKGKQFGTKEDHVIMLMAHYDTYINTPGVNNDGSGAAAVLKVAEMLHKNVKSLEHTIIILLTDWSEFGQIGSLAYIRDQLIPTLNRYKIHHGCFQGAIVIDSAMNWQGAAATQNLPESFTEEMSFNYDEVNKRGDFLALATREVETELANTFQKYWNTVKYSPSSGSYKTVHLEVPISGRPKADRDSFRTMIQLGQLERSDHKHFWNYGVDSGIAAMYLTDTGSLRSGSCYHEVCDSVQQINSDKLGFLAKTTETLFKMLLHLGTNPPRCIHLPVLPPTQPPRPSRRPNLTFGKSTNSASLNLMSFSTLIALFLFHWGVFCL